MRERHFLFSCLCWLFSNIFAGQINAQISLTFMSESRESLIGVSVQEVDGDFAGISDQNGQLLVPSDILPSSFLCSYLGFEAQVLDLVGDQNLTVLMQATASTLDVVEIVGRGQNERDLLPQTITTLNRAEISQLTSQTAADVLESTGSIYVQRSQMGGGSPVMRGFEANKVLLVVDGVRLNNLIYRGGHLQNAITVDHAALERMELIFGPGSLMYGSDALGGVLHFQTLEPRYNTEQSIGLRYQFSSVNLGSKMTVTHQYGSEKFASASALSYGNFGDLRIGKNRHEAYDEYPTYGLTDLYYDREGNLRRNQEPTLQRNTGYSQYDVLHKMKFRLGSFHNLIFNAQLSSSSEIPRFDQLSLVDSSGIPEFRTWHYGPQNRLLLSAKLESNKSTKVFDKYNTILSFQEIEESRIRQFSNSDFERTQIEDVQVIGWTADFSKYFRKNIHLSYGSDIHINKLQSSVDNRAGDGSTLPAFTRYPDGDNSLIQYGLYSQLAWYTFAERLRITGGVRYSGQQVKMSYLDRDVIQWPEYFYSGITNNSQAFIGSGSATYKLGKLALKYAVGQGFRAPNIDDLAKIRVKVDELTVPNPELQPERTINHELSALYSSAMTNVEVVVFQTTLTNAILRANFALPDGSTAYTDGDGNTYQVVSNQNISQSKIKGVSIFYDQKLGEILTFKGRLNYTQGRRGEEATEEPLDHIPPVYGSVTIDFNRGKYSGGVGVDFNAAKPIEEYGGSVDNPEYALPDGTPNWSTLDLSIRRKGEYWNLAFSVTNILDTFYRPFASGVSAPGRSYNITLGASF